MTFRVPLDADKRAVKAAVEGLFNVKVNAVNTIRVKGKLKRFRGRPGRRSDYKKAIVTLGQGPEDRRDHRNLRRERRDGAQDLQADDARRAGSSSSSTAASCGRASRSRR